MRPRAHLGRYPCGARAARSASGRDDLAFVKRLFGWIASHPRVQMQLYNQGKLTNGPFRLRRYPRSKDALRTALRRGRNLDAP